MNLRRTIYEYIIGYQSDWHRTPSRGDIRALFSGLSDEVDLHLEQLQREGLIALEGSTTEAITVPPTFAFGRDIKIRGTTGRAKSCSRTLGQDSSLILDLAGTDIRLGADMYAIQVADDLMIDAGVQRGDVAIIAHSSPARGDIVAVEIDGRLILRRYVILSGINHLLAENPQRPNLVPAFELVTHGVLWGIVRAEARPNIQHQRQRRKVTYSDDATLGEPATEQGLSVVAPSAKGAGKKKSASRERHRKGGGVLLSTTWPDPPSGHRLNDINGEQYNASGKSKAST